MVVRENEWLYNDRQNIVRFLQPVASLIPRVPIKVNRILCTYFFFFFLLWHWSLLRRHHRLLKKLVNNNTSYGEAKQDSTLSTLPYKWAYILVWAVHRTMSPRNGLLKAQSNTTQADRAAARRDLWCQTTRGLLFSVVLRVNLHC